MPVNAHGYLSSGDYLVLGANWPPEAPWSFRRRTGPQLLERTSLSRPALRRRARLSLPALVRRRHLVELRRDRRAGADRDATGVELATWDHLGQTGVVGHPFLLGDLLIFASDQSRTGVATYDVSDPTNPVLLDVLTTGGPGGYWPELWGGDGKLYIVFPYHDERQRHPGRRRHRPVEPAASSPTCRCRARRRCTRSSRTSSPSSATTRSTCAPSSRCSTSTAPTPYGQRRRRRHRHQPVRAAARQPAGHRRHRRATRGWRSGRTSRRRTRAARRSAFTCRAPGATNYPVGAPISLLIHETLETLTIVNGVTFIVRPLGGSRSPAGSPSRSTTC